MHCKSSRAHGLKEYSVDIYFCSNVQIGKIMTWGGAIVDLKGHDWQALCKPMLHTKYRSFGSFSLEKNFFMYFQ